MLLAVALLAVPAEAGKKRKKKKQKPPEASSAVEALEAVERSLWAYDTQGAHEALEPLLAEATPEVLTAHARVLEQQRSYGDATADLRKAAEKSPADPAPLVFLGETFLHADDEDAATQAFAEAEARAKARLADSPSDTRALYYLGVAQQRQKKFSAAVETLAKARAKEPDNALIVYQLGTTHAFQRDWTKAVDLLTESISMDSGIAYAYYYRGLAAGQAGRKDLLINDLDRFLFMAPEAPEADRARKVRNAG